MTLWAWYIFQEVLKFDILDTKSGVRMDKNLKSVHNIFIEDENIISRY
jgi:hypothetical protein